MQELRTMLHETRDRQKFVSDVQYLRDMQHKVDSEYQACLKRQENKKEPNEKKQEQLWVRDTSDRSRFSSGSSCKQSSCEEDSHSEARLSTKTSSAKYEPRLPAIDQTSVKQKHKGTMTLKKSEKVSPSKPSPVAQAPKILSRKRRPNLGRLTVSPEMHSPRASAERSKQKPQLSTKASGLLGADPVVHQESLLCANETKLKKPARERRKLAPSSQPMRTAGKPREKQKKGDLSAHPQTEPHTALSQTFQPMNGSQVLNESLGPSFLPTTVVGPRRTPFRFHDEDFYSAISLNNEQESYDTEEETHMEEELLLSGMRSPPSYKRSRFLGTSAAQNRNVEENVENLRGNSLRWSEPSPGSPRKTSTTEPATKQPSPGQRMLQDTRLPSELAKENPSGDQDEKTPVLGDAKSDGVIQVSADDVSSGGTVEDRSAVQNHERDWQHYYSGSRTSFDCLLSGRPTAPRSSLNPSYNAHGSLLHSALIDDIPANLSMSSILVPSSDLEENLRFNVRRPLSPIRNRIPLAAAEGCSDEAQGTQEMASMSHTQEPPLLADLPNPQSSVALGDSPSSPTRRHLQGHFYMPGSLQENIPFTFFAVSDFANQNDNGTSVRVSGVMDEKATEIKADPEKLRKLQESLLEEDSEEEEGDLCRICQIAGGSPANPLLEPCGCVGSLQFVHQECLKKWLKVKITSGADLGTVKTCEMCKQGLLVDLDDFNMTEFYHKHQQSRAQSELMNSGLYLVLLLHLYEQRFAELMTLNYRRASRERLSRNYPQPRPEENESSESGDGNASNVYPGRVI
ncbi:probable E3 ubiquitin-protein ligase MARCH10 isoform X2 [Mus caroli]|uniref:RING-type E3 ubiquitin transferase n=1 Tax=Mus caroli TaxID=10089 RepID=A0A6P5QTA9_MUSCR|nr:probable E3 ubiquitin-protein ligase MARCH10 isoform X2 [Mus caroli]XP_021033743.1 probable E3 ubiquitin-protein ligase MARCH10 isoform X2 [Mus caroli]XP_021033744.1 probable E3 ubiquitin-protein ligase MARCH10 isoform X2 [Mus caroli]